MKKYKHSKKGGITIIGLCIFLCSAWALTPLWVNPCNLTHLNKDEIEQLKTNPNWKNLSLEQQAESIKYYQALKIPCGAQDLPLRDKLEAARFQAGVLDEIEILSLITLRVEFTGILENTDLYHYRGYTFFSIQVFDAVGGGSGYYEIGIWQLLPERK